MKTLHFSIEIDAPKEKVWNTMLEDATYREWTATFMPGSYVKGSWGEGNRIQFVAPDEKGILSGMASQIVKFTPYNFVSIKHLGVVENNIVDITSDEAKKWVGFENYTFTDKNGKTELTIDLDMREEGAEMMAEAWPKALQKLKEITEG